MNPAYKIATQAGSTIGVKHTEATKTLMKLNYSAEIKKRIGDLNRGKPMSLETRNKIRDIALTRPPSVYRNSG